MEHAGTRPSPAIPPAAIGLLLVFTLFAVVSPPRAHASESISMSRYGSVAHDSLATGSVDYWKMWGDAKALNAPFAYSDDSQGLHIGVQASSPYAWAGYFAESPDTYAQLFHATITLPTGTIPSGSFNTGLYVQTSSGDLNYIACVASVNPHGYSWEVVLASGLTSYASDYRTLYSQAGGPLTEGCTIVTDGQTYLRVYLGDKLAYEGTGLSLQIPPPFNAYLEVESIYTGGMLYGTYGNYYATTGGEISLLNAPVGGRVVFANSTNVPMISEAVPSDGVATFTSEQLAMPFYGIIDLYDSHDDLVASTGAMTMWAGDTFSASPATIS